MKHENGNSHKIKIDRWQQWRKTKIMHIIHIHMWPLSGSILTIHFWGLMLIILLIMGFVNIHINKPHYQKESPCLWRVWEPVSVGACPPASAAHPLALKHSPSNPWGWWVSWIWLPKEKIHNNLNKIILEIQNSQFPLQRSESTIALYIDFKPINQSP